MVREKSMVSSSDSDIERIRKRIRDRKKRRVERSGDKDRC